MANTPQQVWDPSIAARAEAERTAKNVALSPPPAAAQPIIEGGVVSSNPQTPASRVAVEMGNVQDANEVVRKVRDAVLDTDNPVVQNVAEQDPSELSGSSSSTNIYTEDGIFNVIDNGDGTRSAHQTAWNGSGGTSAGQDLQDPGFLWITTGPPANWRKKQSTWFSEVAAAAHLAGQGRRVVLGAPDGGTRADGGTSDLIVDGVNWDVYTPTSSSKSKVTSKVAGKHTQAHGGGVIVDLHRTQLTAADLGDVLTAANGMIRDWEARGHVKNPKYLSEVVLFDSGLPWDK